jgi:chromosome segregation ATPase
MKRILLAACLAAMLPTLALAQTTNSAAKVDPKNNKVSRPVVEKPKPVLMSRDQLRACLKRQDDNVAEAKAVRETEAAHKAEREKILADKQELQVEADAISANVTAIKAEQADILKSYEEIKVKLPDLKKKEQQALLDGYAARAKEHDAKVEAHNKRKDAYQARAATIEPRIDAYNQLGKDLENRSLDNMDAVDLWKKECGNKPYDEADERAIKKEKEAAAAAAAAASSAQ